jgi:hypothetical protein
MRHFSNRDRAGKWRKDLKRAIEQGKRWQRTEPFAQIHIASTNGMKATLEEIEAAEKIRRRSLRS